MHTRVHHNDTRRLDQAHANNHTRVGALWPHHPGCDCSPVGLGKDTHGTLEPEREGCWWPERTTRRPQIWRSSVKHGGRSTVTTTNSTCDGRRPENQSRPHQAAHDKMLKEFPKDKPTNQLEQNTIEVTQVHNEQGHREDDTDFPVPQTTDEVTDLSSTVEQSDNAVTRTQHSGRRTGPSRSRPSRARITSHSWAAVALTRQ